MTDVNTIGINSPHPDALSKRGKVAYMEGMDDIQAAYLAAASTMSRTGGDTSKLQERATAVLGRMRETRETQRSYFEYLGTDEPCGLGPCGLGTGHDGDCRI